MRPSSLQTRVATVTLRYTPAAGEDLHEDAVLRDSSATPGFCVSNTIMTNMGASMDASTASVEASVEGMETSMEAAGSLCGGYESLGKLPGSCLGMEVAYWELPRLIPRALPRILLNPNPIPNPHPRRGPTTHRGGIG